MSRNTIAVLSTENLLHNLGVIKKHAPTSKIMAMVKANAYGHGIRSVGKRLAPHVDALGVASMDEGLALRKVGVGTRIVLMEGVFDADEYLLAACENFDVVIHSPLQLQWLLGAKLPRPLTVWVKINTGMNRLGFRMDEFQGILQQLVSCASVVHPVGMMSHFACAEDAQHPMNQQQIQNFQACVAGWPGPKSFCNSAGIVNFSACHDDMVRPGIALYGASPVVGVSSTELNLQPVMTLQTRLISVQHVLRGASIGYGARYTCSEDMPVGIIAVGYGDGYPRTARDGMPVLVNNVRCQIVGRVSMDMATIDLRACPHAQTGDMVVLWGTGLPVDDILPYTQHIAFDLFTGVQLRVKFHWTSATS